MAKITINKENFNVGERELEQGTLSIGRNSDNALHIDDPAVSNHHAQIVTVFDSSYVEDLGSTNGTFVNGKKAKTHTLHNGDVLTIGHYQILFQNDAATSAPDANATMMMGVSQLEELTKKAREQETAQALHQTMAEQATHQPVPSATTASVAQQTAPTSSKPRLEVHENVGQPNVEQTELPDIDENTSLLDNTHRIPASPRMHNRRKSDTSPLPSLKVIALSVLATVATFTLLMLLFK